MNANLAQLIELSSLDTNIDAFAPKIAAAKRKSDDVKGQIAALERKIEGFEEGIKEQKAAKLRTENLIAELSQKLEQIKEKAASVSKEKEIQALTVEEDIASEQLNKANGDIERFEKNAAALSEQKAEAASKIDELNKELKGLEADLVEVLAALEKERAAVYGQKEELAKKIDGKLLGFYEKIRKWAKNTAVVPVRKQACYGCFMRLNNKSFAAVRHSDEINTCPHCGRIIYFDSKFEED